MGKPTEETGVNPAGLSDAADPGASERALQRKPFLNLTGQGYRSCPAIRLVTRCFLQG
ncbi:protein of unknown function [Bradyrhizobium sp. ORS 285]|nr:hypothetical protein BRAO285_80016 [Bradyrhizobium sp. ORS 285]SMX61815.1 protein of unknown function [Bradyrhizobium sp. ORS 285]